MTAQGNRRLRLSSSKQMFSSHPDSSKCPSEKEHKKYEAESDEFQRNSSGPASFFVAASTPCIPFPIPLKLLFNPEKEQENKKKAWFIRFKWDCWMEQRQKRLGGRDRRRGHWIGKLKVEYRRECCRIAAMKRERGLVFSRPGRSIFGWTRGWFLVGREQQKCLGNPVFMRVSGILKSLLITIW